MATQVTSINSSGTLYVAGGIDEAMIGTGSVFFNGTNQSLSIVNPVIATRTNDFTIEAWVYATTILPSTPTIASTTIGNSNAGFHWYFGAGGFGVRSYTVNIVLPAGIGVGTALQPNTWYHCAYTRLGNVHSTWLNGALVNSATYSVTFSDSTLTIGTASVGQFFGGYISNLRLINGTAIYTSNFTVTRAPINRLFNTTFLMNKIYGQSTSTNSIVDSSTYNSTVTNVNSAVPVNVNPFSTGDVGSVFFNGSNQSLTTTVATGSPLDLATGAGNWTIEGWFYATSISGSRSIIWKTAGANPAYALWLSAGTPQMIIGDGAGGGLATNLTVVTVNTWYHFAIVRIGNRITPYLNGVAQTGGTSPVMGNGGASTTLYIGGASDSRPFLGYISNIRITKGVAVYSTNTNFTPPTQPLIVAGTQTSLLLSTPFASSSTAFKDSSVNNFILSNNTATSTTFNPFTNNLSNPPTLLNTVERISTQGLQTAGEIDEITLVSGSVNLSTAWVKALNSTSFRTQNLTMECWFYPTASAGNGMIMGGSSQSNGGFGDINIFQVSNALNLYVSAAGGAWAISAAVTGSIDNNRWHHLAMVRNGSTFNVYLNGTSTYVNSSFNYDFTRGSQPIFIGGNDYLGGPNNVFAGYISNARVVVGTAVYTSNFTPPAAPLTATADTFWLLSTPYNNNYLRDFSTSTSVSLTAGTVTSSNLSPFSTVGSLFFNGTSQYLTVPTSTSLNFGTGNFTVEAWINTTAANVGDFFIISATGSGGFFFGYNSAAASYGWGRAVIAWDYYTGATKTNGVWQHIALVRSGIWMRMFLNGQQAGTAQALDTSYDLTVTSTVIGWQQGAYYLPGYLSNLRVLKGVAVYNTNSNFTPLLQPLTVMGTQTSLSLTTPLGTGAFIDSSLNNLSIGNVNATASSILNPFTNNLGNPPTTTSTVQRVNSNGLQVSGSFDEFSMNRGSVQFNGTSQYLTVPSNAAFDFGTSNFTIEFWTYFNALTTDRVLVDRWASGNANSWQIYWRASSSSIVFLVGAAAVLADPGTTNIVANSWAHIAVTRLESTNRLFINGILVATATNSTSLTNSLTLAVGAQFSTIGSVPLYFSGYISNLRIVKNVAVYTSNFTRPTTPFSSTNVYSTQTSILLNTVAYPPLNTVDSSLNNFTVTPTAAPLPSELNPFV